MDSSNIILILIGLTLYMWCRYYCRPDEIEETTDVPIIHQISSRSFGIIVEPYRAPLPSYNDSLFISHPLNVSQLSLPNVHRSSIQSQAPFISNQSLISIPEEAENPPSYDEAIIEMVRQQSHRSSCPNS